MLILLVAVLAVAVWMFVKPGPPAQTPSNAGDLDWSKWSLTVPVEGSKGVAETVTPARPYAPWVRVGSDGSVTFMAASDGATTRGSQYPRSELREQLTSGDNRDNWTSDQTATLSGELAVEKVPESTEKLIFAQIHGYNGDDSDIGPLVMLYYVRGEIQIVVRAQPTDDEQTRTVAATIPLGQRFSYEIAVRDRDLRISVDGKTAVDTRISDDWDDVGLYFKAGAYVQSNQHSPVETGETRYFGLTTQH